MTTPLVYLRPARLAFVRVTGPYDQSIPQAWEKMLTWIEKNGFKPQGERGYGLAHDNPMLVDPAQCRFDACVQLSAEFQDRAERELGMKTLPGGPYTRIRKSGGYGRLRQAMTTLYSEPTIPEGLHLDTRRPIVTIYLDDPRRFSPRELRADVCVPVSTGAVRHVADAIRAA